MRSYLSRQAKAASARGHELVVVAPGPQDAVLTQAGGRVIRYKAPRMPYDPTYHVPWRIDVMRRLVLEERPDVIQVSSPFLPALAARTIDSSAVKVYFYHSDPMGCYVRPLLKAVLPPRAAGGAEHFAWGWQRAVCGFCDATVVAGTWLEALLKQQGCQRVKTVPFGISRDELGPHRRDEQLRRELLGPLADRPGARLLIITGRLAADKRQRLLVQSLKAVASDLPVALVVVGDGPEREKLQILARSLPHSTFIPFVHDRSRYAAMLASADALLHGSRCETFGFVVAEALASGTPAIVPGVGGAAELVNQHCAEIYPEDATAKAIAVSIRRLLSRPRPELSQAAIEAAQTIPSTEQHFDLLFDFYESLLRDRRRPAGHRGQFDTPRATTL